MTLDAFARCPTPGCEVDVYAPFAIPTRCRAHGGPDVPQFLEPDPFGLPRTASARADPPLPEPRPPLETA